MDAGYKNTLRSRRICSYNWYSRTSISVGTQDGEHSDTSPFPGYTCAKKAKYIRIFLPFSRTNYENSLFNGFIP